MRLCDVIKIKISIAGRRRENDDAASDLYYDIYSSGNYFGCIYALDAQTEIQSEVQYADMDHLFRGHSIWKDDTDEL